MTETWAALLFAWKALSDREKASWVVISSDRVKEADINKSG